MKSGSCRWSIAGIAAGALCLALVTSPALANSADDEDNSAPQTKKEVRVYRNDDRNTPDPGAGEETRRGNDDSEEAQIQGGYLGVRVQDITPELQNARDLPNTQGALINRVEPGSPADEAGVRRGDVILELNRHSIDDSRDLISQVGDLDPGARVSILVLRNGARKSVSVTLAKRPREFQMMAPRGRTPQMDRAYGDRPDMSQLGDQLDKIDGDLQRLEDEIRALREELKARDGRRSPHSD